MAVTGRAAIAIMLLAAGPLGAAPLRAQQDNAYVELLLEVRINRGPSDIIFALASPTRMLVATGRLLELAEVRQTAQDAVHHLEGVLEPGRTPFRIDTDRNAIRIGERRLPLDPAAAVWRNGDLYLATDELATVLGVTIVVNRAELTAQVLDADHLPAVRRLERERRRRTIGGERVETPGRRIAPARRFVDGAVLDWALSALTEDPLDAASLQLGIGAQVFGGSAVLEHVERRTVTGTERDTRGSWVRAWHHTPVIRQARLGEVLGTGRAPRVVQGVAVTNAPFLRPADFTVAPLVGDLAPGWEVELYRNDRLLDFTRTDAEGRYRFDVPVRYGQNPVELVAYGPHGEVVRRSDTFEIPPLRLPARQFEYGVGAGACALDPCEAVANVDLRYGFTDRVTAQLGVDRFWRDTLPDLWHPYGAVTVQPVRSVSLTGEAVVNALGSGRVDFAPTPDLQAAFVHTRFDNDVVQPLVGSPFARHRTDARLFYRPGLMDDQLFFTASATHAVGTTLTRDAVRVGATTRLRGTRFDLGVVTQRVEAAAVDMRSTAVDGRFFHLYTGSYRWLRRTLFHGELALDLDSGLTRARFIISRTFAEIVQIDVGADWRRGTDGVVFEVGLTTTLPAMRAASRNRIDPGDGTVGTQIAEGSVLWDRGGGRFGVADGRSLGRAGLAGTVFLDVNGNGTRDQGEPPLPDVLVRIGPRLVITDPDGRFAVWDLVPFELTDVEIDTLSIRDPLLVPRAARFTFRPDPNVFTPLPIPIVQAGEVSGRVILEGAKRPIGGVEVELVNLTTGDRYTTSTFSDGAFYLLGVRPGRYLARLGAAALDRLGVRAIPAEFSVGSVRDEAIVDGVEIVLRR